MKLFKKPIKLPLLQITFLWLIFLCSLPISYFLGVKFEEFRNRELSVNFPILTPTPLPTSTPELPTNIPTKLPTSTIPSPTPTKIINQIVKDSEIAGILENSKIAYVQNEKLFVMDATGKKQIFTDKPVDYLRWSKDGKTLAWTNLFKFKQNGRDIMLGTSISSYDLNNKVKEIIPPICTEEELINLYQNKEYNKSRSCSISGFDFSPDSTQIAYSRNGIQIRNLSNGEEIKIAENAKNGNVIIGGSIYNNAEWNPTYPYILLKKSLWECSKVEIFNLNTNQIDTTRDFKCNGGKWSGDGKTIVTYNTLGMYDSGLWITNLFNDSTKPQAILSFLPSTFDVAVSRNNQIIASLQPTTPLEYIKDKNWANNKYSYLGNNLFLISENDSISPITKDSSPKYYRWDLQWVKNDGKISYLLVINHEKKLNDLHLINPDGSDEKTLLVNISTYAWSPE